MLSENAQRLGAVGMLRRSFIASAAVALLSGRASAAPVGLPVAPDLLGAVRSLQGATEGSGGATIHIMFTPWCHISPEIWNNTRSLRGVSIRWLPFSGGQPEGREAVDRFLQNPSASAVPRIFSRLHPLAMFPPTPLSDMQDDRIARLAPLVIRDTGRNLVTPTIVYTLGPERVRVVLGGISAADFLEIARYAG
jgi:hypothetical protein